MKYLVFLLALLLSGCTLWERDEPPVPSPTPPVLPPATQTGANTFGCRIDGLIFKIDSTDWTTDPFNIYYEQGTFGVAVDMIRIVEAPGGGYDTTEANVGIGVWSLVNEEGEYYLYSQKEGQKADANCRLGSTRHYTDSLHTGVLTVTRLDQFERIISGTFYFDAVSSDGQVVEVRDGRFDLRYR